MKRKGREGGYNIKNMKTSKNLSYLTTQIITNIVINNVDENCNNLFLPIVAGLIRVPEFNRDGGKVHELFFPLSFSCRQLLYQNSRMPALFCGALVHRVPERLRAQKAQLHKGGVILQQY